MSTNQGSTTVEKNQSGFRVLGARLTWALLGPAGLTVLVGLIIKEPAGWFTLTDGLFFVVVGIMAWARLSERRVRGITRLDGEPATEADYRRYVRWLVPVAAAIWVVANTLGNHVLPG